MKKILIFFTVLTALLIFQPDLYAVAQCELEVTAGSTNPTVDWDPCVVISRSGIREGDIWIPQDDNKYCQDFSMQATKNNKSGVYSDESYRTFCVGKLGFKDCLKQRLRNHFDFW